MASANLQLYGTHCAACLFAWPVSLEHSLSCHQTFIPKQTFGCSTCVASARLGTYFASISFAPCMIIMHGCPLGTVPTPVIHKGSGNATQGKR